MARPCAICAHESRAAIEQAILNQKPLRRVAETFGFTYVARTGAHKGDTIPDHKVIQRHRDTCMADAYQTAMAERQNESGVAIASRLRMLDEEVDRVIQRANEGRVLMVGDVPLLDDEGKPVKVHDSRLLLAAIREGRGNLELLAKLSGRTDTEPEDLDTIRKYLESPAARRLLAELDRLQADEDRQDAT